MKFIAGMECKIIVLLLLVILTTSCSVQKQAANASADKQIQWSDFSGKIENMPYNAYIYWNVDYSIRKLRFISDTAKVEVKVTCRINKRSWVKPDNKSDELLNHERGHFSIAQILSLELTNEYKRNFYLKQNYRYKIDSIFYAVKRPYTEMELRYDAETRHMYDTAAQNKWDQYFISRKRILKQQLLQE
jgi:hypothetical protein